MSMYRRDFLKFAAGVLAPLVIRPVAIFVPPREPFISVRTGLDNLYSHLGILPSTYELSTCEGRLLEIDAWDGTGYPCLIQNACQFGPNPPRIWIYDFDLWNFRDDDEYGHIWKRADFQGCGSHREWHARKRFGSEFRDIALSGGGVLSRHIRDRESKKHFPNTKGTP